MLCLLLADEKTKRVCHINLVKPYHEREPRLDPQFTEIEPEVVGLVDPVEDKPSQKVSSSLTTHRKLSCPNY